MGASWTAKESHNQPPWSTEKLFKLVRKSVRTTVTAVHEFWGQWEPQPKNKGSLKVRRCEKYTPNRRSYVPCVYRECPHHIPPPGTSAYTCIIVSQIWAKLLNKLNKNQSHSMAFIQQFQAQPDLKLRANMQPIAKIFWGGCAPQAPANSWEGTPLPNPPHQCVGPHSTTLLRLWCGTRTY